MYNQGRYANFILLVLYVTLFFIFVCLSLLLLLFFFFSASLSVDRTKEIMTRASRKAQEKMQSALRRANDTSIFYGESSSRSVTRQVGGGSSRSLTRQALERNRSRASLRDHEVSASAPDARNSYDRCMVLTFVTVDPETNFKIVVPIVSVQDPDQGSVANFLVPPASVNSFLADSLTGPSIHHLGHSYSPQSLTYKTFGADDLGQSSNSGLVNRRAKLSKDSGDSSQQNSFVSSNHSTSTYDNSDTTWLPDLAKDKSLAEKSAKRSSRKKAKKKGKQSKKSHKTKPGLEALCEKDDHEAFFSEACTNNDMKREIESIANNKLAENDVVNGNAGIPRGSSLPVTISCSNDGVKTSKLTGPSAPQILKCEDSIASSANKIGGLLSDSEEVADICPKPGSSDNGNAPLLDSASGDLNSDMNANAGDDYEEQGTLNEDDGFNFSGANTYGTWQHRLGKEYFSHGHHSTGSVNAYNCAEISESIPDVGCSELHLFEPVTRRRRGKIGKKLTSSYLQKPSIGLKHDTINSIKASHVHETNSKELKNVSPQHELSQVTSETSHCSVAGSKSNRCIDCSKECPSPTSKIDSTPSAITSEPMAQTRMLSTKLEAELCQKMANSSGSAGQKWISVVRKEAAMEDSSGADKVLMLDLDDSVYDCSSMKNIAGEGLHSRAGTNAPVTSCRLSFKDVNSAATEDECLVEKLRHNATWEPKDKNGSFAMNNNFTPISKDRITSLEFERNLNKLVQAAKEAYQTHLVSEGVQLANGCPLADFERLIESASAVLGHSHNFLPCHSCSRDQFIDASLCKHEVPNIPLGKLWQWYESHGIYGLEVMAQGYWYSHGMASYHVPFTAYFVPFLSAVQLFGSSRFGPELLFQYVETEQPPHRPPLFEKIMELVKGDVPLDSRAYGDPKKLGSSNLHNLHPSSWYCVAWYPIYRIPNGEFQAAFLTYHSLGHLVHRGSSSNFSDGDNCIVSPVVGLQSYKAQGECWFQIRPNATIPNVDCGEILNDRLRALERTASIMANAVTRKNSKSENGHHDYVWFTSRWRQY